MEPVTVLVSLGEMLIEKGLDKAGQRLAKKDWQDRLASTASKEAHRAWARRRLRKWLHRKETRDRLMAEPSDPANLQFLINSLAVAIRPRLRLRSSRYREDALAETARHLLEQVIRGLLASLEPSHAVSVAHEREMRGIAGIAERINRRDKAANLVDHLPPLVRQRFDHLKQIDESLTALMLTTLLTEERMPKAALGDLLTEPLPTWLSEAPPYAWVALGEFAAAYGAPSQAGYCFEKAALEGAPVRARWMARAALSYVQARDAAKGQTLIVLASEMSPDDAGVKLIRTLIEISDPKEIVAVLEADPAATDFDGVSLRAYYAVALSQAGQLGRAVEVAHDELAIRRELTGLMLQLAAFLLTRAQGETGADRDASIKEASRLSRRARELRREWRSESCEAVVMMIQTAIASGDIEAVFRYASPEPMGEATSEEASYGPVAQSAAVIAIGRDRQDIVDAALSRIVPGFHRLIVEGMLAAKKPDERDRAAGLLTQALDQAEDVLDRVEAWRALASIGVWPIPRLEELRSLSAEEADYCISVSEVERGLTQSAIARLRPESLRSRRHAELLAEAYVAADRIDDAVETFRTASRLFGDPVLSGSAALLLARSGRYPEATAEAKDALLRLYPSSPMTRTLRKALAELLWKQKDWAGVVQQAEAYLAEAPEDQDVRWLLAGALFNRRNYEQAWQALGAGKLQPRDLQEAVLWMLLVHRFQAASLWIDQALELLRRYRESDDLAQAFMEAIVRHPPDPAIQAGTVDAIKAATADATEKLVQAKRFEKIDLTDEEALKRRFAELLEPGAAAHAELSRQVSLGLWPLGALATSGGRTYTEVLVKGEPRCLPIYSTALDARALERSAISQALDHRVVVDPSTLAVLSLVRGLWAKVVSSFSSSVMSSGARNDVVAGRDSLSSITTQFMSWNLEAKAVTLMDVPAPLVETWRERSEWMADVALRMLSLDRDSLPHFPQADMSRFGGWLGSIELAAELKCGLFSDDLGARTLARSMGVETFGTIALLEVLAENGVITSSERSEACEVLRRERFVDIPFEVPSITALAQEEGWQPGIAWLQVTRPGFWRDGSAGRLYASVLDRLSSAECELLPHWLSAAIEGAQQFSAEPELTIGCGAFLGQAISRCWSSKAVPGLLAAARAQCRRLKGGDPLEAAVRYLRQELTKVVDLRTAIILITSWTAELIEQDKLIVNRILFT